MYDICLYRPYDLRENTLNTALMRCCWTSDPVTLRGCHILLVPRMAGLIQSSYMLKTKPTYGFGCSSSSCTMSNGHEHYKYILIKWKHRLKNLTKPHLHSAHLGNQDIWSLLKDNVFRRSKIKNIKITNIHNRHWLVGLGNYSQERVRSPAANLLALVRGLSSATRLLLMS